MSNLCVIDESLKSREGAAQEAEEYILEGYQNFLSYQRVSGVGDALKRFRSQAEMLQQRELAKSLSALKNGADPDVVLAQLARSLTNKLIHEPTVQVRKAAEEGSHHKADWLLDLFGINSSE